MISLESVRAAEEFAVERGRFDRLMTDLHLMADQGFRVMPGRPFWLDVARIRDINRRITEVTDDYFGRTGGAALARERSNLAEQQQEEQDGLHDVIRAMDDRYDMMHEAATVVIR